MIEKKEIQQKPVEEKPVTVKEEPKPEPVQKANMPISNGKKPSKFSITEALNKKEEEEQSLFTETKDEDLPNNHFTETDLHNEWSKFLEDIRKKDIVLYSAINGFRFSKLDEDTILVNYPSDTAKSEFEKVQGDFFNHFKRKVNHHTIKIDYRMDVGLKMEIVTKRSLFEKMAEKNPVLRDLDDLLKFDFS